MQYMGLNNGGGVDFGGGGVMIATLLQTTRRRVSSCSFALCPALESSLRFDSRAVPAIPFRASTAAESSLSLPVSFFLADI